MLSGGISEAAATDMVCVWDRCSCCRCNVSGFENSGVMSSSCFSYSTSIGTLQFPVTNSVMRHTHVTVGGLTVCAASHHSTACPLFCSYAGAIAFLVGCRCITLS